MCKDDDNGDSAFCLPRTRLAVTIDYHIMLLCQDFKTPETIVGAPHRRAC
jgi:hypothetical protein